MAMQDVKWQDHLHSTDHEAIMKAYHTEWNTLKSSILVELDPTHPEYREAVRWAMVGRCILKFKRTGVRKVRGVVHGYKEDKVYLDSEGFDYAANVCEISAVRNLPFEPCEGPYTGKTDGSADANNDNGNNTTNSDPIVIGQADVRTAYLQSDRFGPDELCCYLHVKDLVTGKVLFFLQTGCLCTQVSVERQKMGAHTSWMDCQAGTRLHTRHQ